MGNIESDKDKLIAVVANILKNEGDMDAFDMLSNCQVEISQNVMVFDSNDYYKFVIRISPDVYAAYEDVLSEIETAITDKLNPMLRPYKDCVLERIIIAPNLGRSSKGDKKKLSEEKELVQSIEKLRDIMISVSTGGPRIQAVNNEYQSIYQQIGETLQSRDITDPNPYADLWQWYGKWSSGDLPTWASRRKYINALYMPLIELLGKSSKAKNVELFSEPIGWAKVDKEIGIMRLKLERAKTEREFQAIGLYCREAITSLAQIVFDSSIHKTVDGVEASDTDAKRMLEAYISTELRGSSNEEARGHAKAALKLANGLAHKRTADFREAALCAEATTSVINIIAIISGQRDPDNKTL